MRVAVEASLLVKPPYSGIARCTYELVDAMAALPEAPSIDLYFPRRKADRSKVRPLARHPKVTLRAELHPALRPRRRYDLSFATYKSLVPRVDAPSVLWLHDLYLQRGISSYDELHRRDALRETQQAVDAAQHFVCISESTRRDAIALLGLAPERLHVVPHGISERFKPSTPERCAQVRSSHGLARPYLLFVGLFYENKNLSRLLAAYARSPVRQDFDLAIAGPLPRGDAASARLRHLIAQHRLESRLKLLGTVSDDDLVALYGAAAAFVFPALDEGFGMPILEAMRCGTPVLTSTAAACPEVAGGHAVLVDPYDLDALDRGLQQVVTREARQNDAARRHAERFTWEQSARQMLAIFRKLAGTTP